MINSVGGSVLSCQFPVRGKWVGYQKDHEAGWAVGGGLGVCLES